MISNRILEMSEEEIRRVEILRMAEEKRITTTQPCETKLGKNGNISKKGGRATISGMTNPN